MSQVVKDFHKENPWYNDILTMSTDDINNALHDIILTKTEVSGPLTYHSDKRIKRSILPLDGLSKFLFSTADQDDLDNLKHQVKQIYQNQLPKTKVLNKVTTVTNISRGLINENRNKVNTITGTITALNETIEGIISQIGPLFTAR